MWRWAQFHSSGNSSKREVRPLVTDGVVCQVDWAFPVLLARGGRDAATPDQGGWLELRLRLGDRARDPWPMPWWICLPTGRGGRSICRFRLRPANTRPRVETWVVDVGSAPCNWPAAAHGVTGDSFSLALLFQLVAECQDANWPDGVFVTGAVHRARGFRCVAVGQAVEGSLAGVARYGGCCCRRNYHQLGRAGST